MSIRRTLFITSALLAVPAILGIATITNMYLGGEFDKPAPQTVEQVEPPTPVYRHDPEVIGYMQELGLDYNRLNLYYADDPELPGSPGTFNAPNSVYLSPTAPEGQRRAILLHEYVHYVQAVKDVQGAEAFYPYIAGLRRNNGQVSQRMANYKICDTCSIDRETQAVACTEVPDSALREDFRSWCNKWLPKRSELL